MPTEAANSFTPIARITLPSATWIDTPPSVAAGRNSRANVLRRRPLASPSFQSVLLFVAGREDLARPTGFEDEGGLTKQAKIRAFLQELPG